MSEATPFEPTRSAAQGFVPGRLPKAILQEMLDRAGGRSKRVLVGMTTGEDAAAVLHTQPVLVVAQEPLSYPTRRPGWHSVHLNANQVAARGADPAWFCMTVMVGDHEAHLGHVESIFSDAALACHEVGAELVGGQTERVPGLVHTLVVGTMLGEVTTSRLTTSRNARPGDAIVLLGEPGLLGTALLAEQAADLLLQAGVESDEIHQAARLLLHPGISLVKAARHAVQQAPPHSMHNLGRGGLNHALIELAQTAGLGLEIEEERVSVHPSTQRLAQALGADPWNTLGGGAMLLTCTEHDVTGLVEGLRQKGFQAARIGRALSPETGLHRVSASGRKQTLHAGSDPFLDHLPQR